MCACAEDCKIYSEDCRGGLEGGYVRALIKNLVCKKKNAKAIRFSANGHHESDHQTRKDKCRVQRLLHVQINNSRPTAQLSVHSNIKHILRILERNNSVRQPESILRPSGVATACSTAVGSSGETRCEAPGFRNTINEHDLRHDP